MPRRSSRGAPGSNTNIDANNTDDRSTENMDEVEHSNGNGSVEDNISEMDSPRESEQQNKKRKYVTSPGQSEPSLDGRSPKRRRTLQGGEEEDDEDSERSKDVLMMNEGENGHANDTKVTSSRGVIASDSTMEQPVNGTAATAAATSVSFANAAQGATMMNSIVSQNVVVATTTTTTSKKLEPIANLRPPSQHTPGKNRETPISSFIRRSSGNRLVFDTQHPLRNNFSLPSLLRRSTPAVTQRQTPLQANQEEKDGSNDNSNDNGEIHLDGTVQTFQDEESPSIVQTSFTQNWFWLVVLLWLHFAGVSIVPSMKYSCEQLSKLYGLEMPTTTSTLPKAVLLPGKTKKKASKPRPVQKKIQTVTVEEVDVPDSIVQGLNSIKTLSTSYSNAVDRSTKQYDSMFATMLSLEKAVQERRALLNTRNIQLSKVHIALSAALAETNTSSHVWDYARRAATERGLTLIDVPSVELWQVDKALDCSSSTANTSDASTGISTEFVTPEKFKKQVEDIQLVAHLTATKLVRSRESIQKVRDWVDGLIQKEVRGSPKLKEMFSKEPSSSLLSSSHASGKGMDFDQLNFAIQERLEMERADRTGRVDYASLYNGAKIIKGGRRGTTKSLVDSLPILNRLLHVTAVRFYGYGPEAALTPTYPSDALGQCWSLQPQLTSMDQQLERRRYSMSDDDHKRGNFGTLTISLPSRVTVDSVIIEHPPKSTEYQRTSAIRSFRIIGYKDENATSKSISLGSFEYNIHDDFDMQEFKVATTISGQPVPPLRSITLAIDSNWGNDYACLYRFRVHGKIEGAGE